MSEFVKVTRRGLGSRTKNSFGGALFGFVLLAAGSILLFWNEGRAVKRYQDLKEGAGSVVSVSSTEVDSANDGLLVHLSGRTSTSGPLLDEDFGVEVDAIKLVRSVEMFQWVQSVETRQKERVGGSTETEKTYSYRTEWKESPVDSSRFEVPHGHQNPGEMKYRSTTLINEGVMLDAFELPEFLVRKIGGSTPIAIESLDALPPELRDSARLSENTIYLGENPQSPQVGDLRVSFSLVPNGPVSVVAQQQGNTFTPFKTKTGGSVDLLERGEVPAADMFQLAQDRNKFLTWAIRAGGFFMLSTGFTLILGPLAVFASILPILGRIARTGTAIISFLLAGVVWTLVVGFAWIFHRPVLGIFILAATVALIVLIVKKVRASRETATSAPPLETPPPLT